MVYTADDSAIAEARENLRETEYEIQKNGLENQKKLLEETKTLYQEQQDLLQEKMDGIDEQLSDIEDSYEQMTYQLNEQKERWQEILDIFTQAQNMQLVKDLFGTYDLDKLNGGIGKVENAYVQAIALMNSENLNFIDALGKITGADFSNLSSIPTENLEQVIGLIMSLGTLLGGDENSVKTSAEAAKNAIAGDGKAKGKEGEGEVENVQTAIEDANAAALDSDAGFPAATTAIEGMNSTLGETVEQLKDVQNEINATASAMERLNSMRGSIAPTKHAKGTVGSAFANGTGYDGLKSAEKNALRSEYGQPELTVYPNGTYEVTNTPTLSDLPKDTVIFNERQTKKILNSGGIKGKAFAEGTQNQTVMFAGKERSLSDIATLSAKLTEGFNLIGNTIKNVGDNIASQVTNLNSVVNNRREVKQEIKQEFNITMPNITDKTSAESLMRDLQSLSSKKIQYFLNA